MHAIGEQQIFFISLSVLLFILLGVVILILIDHKSKIPGQFQHNPFSIVGMRRDHPVIAFVTAFFLGAIIISLLLEMVIVLGEHAGLFGVEETKPGLLKKLSQQRYSESQRHFHNVPVINKVGMGKKTVCFQCHGDFPHSKQRMVRTLLNMHTQFVGCVTCHIDPRIKSEENYKFRWLNYSGIEVTGVPYGTDINKKSGYLIDTDDYYSQIVIYFSESGNEELLEVTEDNPDVKEFIQIKDSLTDEDKELVKNSFHKNIMSKGRFCSRCHTHEDKSYLPFRSLGFSEQRINDITNLNIVGIVEKYREFYMPNLFKSDPALPGLDAMMGDEIKAKVPNEEILKGRAWWRRNNE